MSGNTNNTVFIQRFFSSRDNFVDGNVQEATANTLAFVGQEGRIWWEPTTNKLYYSDGVTPGGIPISAGTGSPAGTTNSIQLNKGDGNFIGYATLNFNSTTSNLTLLGNLIGKFANGNTNMNIPSANGNLTISVSGNANIAVLTGTGVNVDGTMNATYFIGDGSNLTNLPLDTYTGNISAGNFIATSDYYYSNGDSILDTVIDYYANVNTGNITGGNITISNVANLGNFTISDQTLGGTVATHPIDISPLGDAPVRVLNGIEVYQGSFTPPPRFSVSNVGLVSTRVSTLVSTVGAFEIIGNPLGTAVAPQLPGTMLHITGQAGTPTRIYNDGVANYAVLINRRYNGTSASPTGILADQIIGRVGATPYLDNGGSGEWPVISTVRLDFVSTQAQTPAHQGTRIEMWSVPTNTNTPVKIAVFDDEGIVLTGNLIPNSTTGQYCLGDSTHKWSNVWIGPSTIFMEDGTTHTDANLEVVSGALILGGAADRYQVGNMQVTETGLNLTTGPAGANLLIGTGSDTGHLQINMAGGIKFSDGNIQTTAAIPTGEKGAALGVVPLTAATKIDPIYLPAGSLVYKGVWDATTNLPHLQDGTGSTGDQYECTVAGTQTFNSVPTAFNVSDFVTYNGTVWQRIPGSGSGVTSWGVTGNIRTGDVVMSSLDVTTVLASGSLTNAKLANPNVEIKNGAGISGGGVIQLGGNITLIADVSDVVGGTGVTVTPTSGSHSVAIGQPVGTANSVQFFSVSATTTIAATSNISGGNVTTGGQVVASGNVVGSNLITTGTANVTGNIYGNNILAKLGLYANGDPITGDDGLIVGPTGYTTTANTIAHFTGNSAAFTQINFQNINANGSADWVSTADNGDDSTYYIDMGINGSNYHDSAYTIFGKNDGYLYTVGSDPTGPGTAGNLVLGSTSGNVKVFTGNTITSSLRTTTSSTGFAVIGNISATGNVSGANVTGTHYGAATGLTAIPGGNVSGQVANALVAGTVYTNAQPNVTSVGTLTGITSTGTANLINASNVSLGPVANVHITGGTANYALITNGSGALSWTDIAGISGGSTQTVASWTPRLVSSGGGSFTYSVQSGYYIKSGRNVSCFFTIAITGASGVSGTVSLSDLPVTSINQTNAGGGALDNYTFAALPIHVTGLVAANGNTMHFYWHDRNVFTNTLALMTTGQLGTTATLIGRVNYISAA